MSRFIITVCAGICLIATRPTLMIAQDSSYDQNALRIEFQTGDTKIVRGISGTLVRKVRAFRRTDLASVVSGSPNAVAEARIFERDYLPGSWVAALGLASLGASAGAWKIHDLNRVVPTALTILGMASLSYGGVKLHSAYRSLSKAIWWYNRDLNR